MVTAESYEVSLQTADSIFKAYSPSMAITASRLSRSSRHS